MEWLNTTQAAAEIAANEAELRRVRDQLLDEVDAAGEGGWEGLGFRV